MELQEIPKSAIKTPDRILAKEQTAQTHASLLARAIGETRKHDEWPITNHMLLINGKQLRIGDAQPQIDGAKPHGGNVRYGIQIGTLPGVLRTSEEIYHALGEETVHASGALLYEISRQHRTLSADTIEQAVTLNAITTTKETRTTQLPGESPMQTTFLNIYMPDALSHKMIMFQEPLPEGEVTTQTIDNAKTLLTNPAVQRKLSEISSQAVKVEKDTNGITVRDLDTNNVYDISLEESPTQGYLEQLLDQLHSVSDADLQRMSDEIHATTQSNLTGVSKNQQSAENTPVSLDADKPSTSRVSSRMTFKEFIDTPSSKIRHRLANLDISAADKLLKEFAGFSSKKLELYELGITLLGENIPKLAAFALETPQLHDRLIRTIISRYEHDKEDLAHDTHLLLQEVLSGLTTPSDIHTQFISKFLSYLPDFNPKHWILRPKGPTQKKNI